MRVLDALRIGFIVRLFNRLSLAICPMVSVRSAIPES